MKKHSNFRSIIAITLSISLLLTTVSCDKEKVEDRPDLPPLESLVMDFSDFDQQPGGKKGTDATYENFLHSYLTVLFWNVASTVTLALPVAAYSVALQQDAVYVGESTWEWSFDFPLNSINYSAILTGARISNEEFSMEMEIALAAAPDLGVKWFDGVVRYDHTKATWNLYKDGSVNVLMAEWNGDWETKDATLKYTYMEPNHEQNGSFIMLEYMPDEFYDAAYSISLAAGLTDIQWNTSTLEGRVMDMVKFQDTEWHCWDTQANFLADKDCE
jgi:hypothetical protein